MGYLHLHAERICHPVGVHPVLLQLHVHHVADSVGTKLLLIPCAFHWRAVEVVERVLVLLKTDVLYHTTTFPHVGICHARLVTKQSVLYSAQRNAVEIFASLYINKFSMRFQTYSS